MMAISSLQMVSYSTSIDTSMPVQRHPGPKYIEPIESPLKDSYLASFESALCLSSYSRHLIRKSCDLDLSRFKVIRDQRLCCQS